FWYQVWKWAGIVGDPGGRVLINPRAMPGAKWFPDARLNYAENLLAGMAKKGRQSDALIFRNETGMKRRVSWQALHDQASRVAQALRAAGVKPGDRVAAYLPHIPEAVSLMLGATAIGAVWSSCSPDFGVQGVVDRFGQIEPVVFITADGYVYNGGSFDSLEKARDIVAKLPSVKKVIVVPYLGQGDPAVISGAVTLDDFIAAYWPGPIAYERLPFDHPLYILYSSGTTGVPKCIVHGAGGTLLKQITEQRLHCDLKSGDTLYFFTTLGWMMWNWVVTALSGGATLMLFDGAPLAEGGRLIFDYCVEEGCTHLGLSAKFIDEIRKRGLAPIKTHDLSKVRVVLSTGSPLVPEGFDYVYDSIKRDVLLGSMSGGTDIAGCFVMCNPILPVWRGEIQTNCLGMRVEVYDEEGRPVPPGEKGELVCTQPFPSQPVGFWNDPGDAKYKAAYFEYFPGIWRHGDWCEVTPHGGMIIYGRSDAVLNPGGVRIGTAEIYRQVEQLEEVMESLVIGQTWPPGAMGDVRVVLFVRLREGLKLDDALVAKIKQRIRANTTPRHVPAKVVQVPDIPRTKSNKIVELAVRNLVHGQPVKNVEALANPEALEYFRDRAELRD
ncbi:MAG TPA: acetoacetate--CoA ligase, partial [Burkholderiales bacterium]|nr:acetoacetate--CoA ligase [Burkholderiales bacterium]